MATIGRIRDLLFEDGEEVTGSAFTGMNYGTIYGAVETAKLPQEMPSLIGSQNLTQWVKPTLQLHVANLNVFPRIGSVVHGMDQMPTPYSGAVYSPKQDRTYLVPNRQFTHASKILHYVDGNGNFVAYTHTETSVNAAAYNGGVYSPTQNRIYFVPYGQSTLTNWHYVDCNTGSFVAYAHGATCVSYAYYGGVYSPMQDRIYLVPSAQAPQANWHYIDCATGNVVAYAHGATVGGSYLGGAYSPTHNRIYLFPSTQTSEANWHYIDCNTGNIVAYAHGASVISTGYWGGVYSPTQDRIYLVPYYQSSREYWHYIDCATGQVVSYLNEDYGNVIQRAYTNGVYSPTENRVYFMPYRAITGTDWHYIDCFDGSFQYIPNIFGLSGFFMSSGFYMPSLNRIYMMPNTAQTKWYYISNTGMNKGICSHQLGSAIFCNTI